MVLTLAMSVTLSFVIFSTVMHPDPFHLAAVTVATMWYVLIVFLLWSKQ